MMRVKVTEYTFSSKKNDILSNDIGLKAEGTSIENCVEYEIGEKKSSLKKSNSNNEKSGSETENEPKSIETLILSENLEISAQEKKKKSRKRNKKSKTEKEKTEEESTHPLSQKDEIPLNKRTSFYKLLFPENEEVKQEDKLLKVLEKSHKESLDERKKIKTDKAFKKEKKKKAEEETEKISSPFFQEEKLVKINGLDDLLVQANKEIEFPIMEEFEERLFCVLDIRENANILVPFGFRYYLHRFFKYQVYLSQGHTIEEIARCQLKFIESIRYYCLELNNKSINSEKEVDRISYMEQFISNLLPLDNTEMFADVYLEVGLEYLKILNEKLSQQQDDREKLIPSVNSLRMIITNIKRLIFKNNIDFEVDDAKEEDYLLHRTFFNGYLNLFCEKKEKFETSDIIECAEVAKFLKVQHPEFMQFIKEFIQINLQNFSMVEFLLMLGYLVENKNTPYEYFYKEKGNWMKIIESSHDFSNKKTKSCIKLLEIFSRERFLNCEKIYHKLLQIITNNLEAMEGKELVRTLYFYSRTRYGTNPVFISNLVDKISRWLPYLEERQFSLLVRSIGNLNYKSSELVENLKMINYERFLNELKYGCENLGSYYQEILKEVESQSRRKEYFDGEEDIFHSSSSTSPSNFNDSIAAEKIF